MSFDELAGGDDLTPEEEARLRRVHDLLLEAGPPPELPPSLARHGTPPDDAEVIRFPLPRRAAVAAISVAAAVAIGFGVGFLVGHSKTKPQSFAAERVVSMHGSATAERAVLRIAGRDSVGNWPMELQVRGLPQQTARAAYYELWLTKNGKAVVSCGSFRVHGSTTTVRLSVPYSFSHYDGWVVTAQPAGEQSAGRIVLTT
jgi:Anti-sigma-K factor rskA, C-terminal